jgi:capsular polysaccharide export protein
LLDEVDEVWTASSQLGFEALIRGKTARCFAAPFYAGWGLTQDCPTTAEAAAILARRPRRDVPLDALIDAALARYPLYFDVGRRRPVAAEEGLERLASARDAALA